MTCRVGRSDGESAAQSACNIQSGGKVAEASIVTTRDGDIATVIIDRPEAQRNDQALVAIAG